MYYCYYFLLGKYWDRILPKLEILVVSTLPDAPLPDTLTHLRVVSVNEDYHHSFPPSLTHFSISQANLANLISNKNLIISPNLFYAHLQGEEDSEVHILLENGTYNSSLT